MMMSVTSTSRWKDSTRHGKHVCDKCSLKGRRDQSAMRKKKKKVRSGEIPENNSVWGKRVERARVVPDFDI